jgi:S-DNA-T family DNA segregation ATPase FtsK/SpoIIIE
VINRVSQKEHETAAPPATPDEAAAQPSLDLPETPPSPYGGYGVAPEFWDRVLDLLPEWGDEITAIVLVVFGIVSFLSLADLSAEAPLARAWSGALTQLFGYGGVIVSGTILGMGIIILLPKIGVRLQFPPYRLLALEIAFIAALALLHLSMGDQEMRAVARAGQGGGVIGGAMASAVASALGTSNAAILYTALLLLGLAVVFGVRVEQVTGWLRRTSARLQAYADRALSVQMTRAGQRARAQVDPVLARAMAAGRSPLHSLMRIRPDPAHLPPSQRIDLASLPPLGVDEPRVVQLSDEDLALFMRPEEKALDISGLGTILKSRGENDEILIERPDGRIKRYFSVASIKEPKKVPKRDKGLPAIELLQDQEIVLPPEEEINKNVVLIENTLLEFDIDIDVVDVRIGPTVTQYAVQPFREKKDGEGGETSVQRTRLNKIASLSSDLALALSAKRLRLETPVPGHSYMGIEVPNKTPSVVALRSVYESRFYQERLAKAKTPLFIPLGRDVAGEAVGIDLAGCPHLLIAGTTGSGKSVCIAAIATALVLDNPPDNVRLVLLDPKMVELSRFNGLPHLLGPVETEQERIIEALRWCTREMDRRYKLLEENAARNIEIYNSRLGQRRKKEQLPYIVIMVDEVGDLMMSRPEETEKTITRLAQMARAVGMHLVVATQRPSVDVITGLIKANFPSRLSFAVASGVDSRVILDAVGAETLLGKGDMLYLAPDASGPRRLQGCFVSDEEVRKVVAHWRAWKVEAIQDGRWERSSAQGPWDRGVTRREFLAETDPMLEDAIALVVAEREASASLIQRRLGLGYPRAARIMDLLEELGVVGEPLAGGRGRRVLIEPGKDPFKEVIDKKSKGKPG